MFRIDNDTAIAVKPAPAAAGTPGYFTNGDPVGGVEATVLEADWLNNVQEELISVLAAAGIAPDKANAAQLLAALRAAGVFETLAKTDATTRAATTEFVRLRSGMVRGYAVVTASQTLTADHLNHVLAYGTSSAGTITLPSSGLLTVGDTLTFYNSTSHALTLDGNGVTIATPLSDATSFVLTNSESVQLAFDGTNWRLVGGSAATRRSGSFVSSRLVGGYQMLPSGIIIQWGGYSASATINNVLFPIAFPNAVLNVSLTNWNNSLAAGSAGQTLWLTNQGDASYSGEGWNLTGFRTFSNTSSATGIRFFAIGY